MFALRPIHLLLPADSHGLAWMSAPARAYNTSAPHINENRSAALGLVGALGFVLLVGHALTGNRVLPDRAPLATLARANIVACSSASPAGSARWWQCW